MYLTALILAAYGAGPAGIAADPAKQTSVSGASTVLPVLAARSRKPTTYCVRTQITSSRIRRTVCQSRAEWLIDGFDPLAPAR